jgi:hypothetical protein
VSEQAQAHGGDSQDGKSNSHAQNGLLVVRHNWENQSHLGSVPRSSKVHHGLIARWDTVDMNRLAKWVERDIWPPMISGVCCIS